MDPGPRGDKRRPEHKRHVGTPGQQVQDRRADQLQIPEMRAAADPADAESPPGARAGARQVRQRRQGRRHDGDRPMEPRADRLPQAPRGHHQGLRRPHHRLKAAERGGIGGVKPWRRTPPIPLAGHEQPPAGLRHSQRRGCESFERGGRRVKEPGRAEGHGPEPVGVGLHAGGHDIEGHAAAPEPPGRELAVEPVHHAVVDDHTAGERRQGPGRGAQDDRLAVPRVEASILADPVARQHEFRCRRGGPRP